MAGNDVQTRPMIIKANESQPFPSEAFIVPRAASQISRAEFLTLWATLVGWFDLVGTRGWRFIPPKLVLKPR